MRHIRQESYLLFWLVAGWLLAAVATNRLFALGLVNYELLYSYVARGWSDMIQQEGGSGMKIVLTRLLETAALLLVCRGRYKKAGVRLLLLTAGLSAGVSLVLLTWCRGIGGLFCFLAAGFPQEPFYLAAWGIVILRYVRSLEVRPVRFWSAFTALMAAGLCSEILLNPIFLKLL